MALNDAVPSSATDVFKRNAEDADKLLNSSGAVTNRLGNQLLSWEQISQSHAAWNNRGAWTTATAYAVNDIWEDGSNWYVVLSAYTSGASAEADIAGPSVVVLSGNFVQGVSGTADNEVQTNGQNRAELGDYTSLFFETESKMSAGETLGGRVLVIRENMVLSTAGRLTANDGNGQKFYVVAGSVTSPSAEVDLGSGLKAVPFGDAYSFVPANEVGALKGKFNIKPTNPFAQIASDVHTCWIGYGGHESFNNIIGTIPSSGANYSGVLGYDNKTDALASAMWHFHGSIETAADHPTMIGGSFGRIQGGSYTVVLGGTQNNIVGGNYTAILGGRNNTINPASGAVITGGYGNINGGAHSTCGGGLNNLLGNSCDQSVISGGGGNTATNSATTISGGEGNTASGDYSAISGGQDNEAVGSYSRAAGRETLTQYGCDTYASGGFANVAGSAQIFDFVTRRATTNATESDQYLDGAAVKLTIPESSAWAIKTQCVASDGTDRAVFEFNSLVFRGAGATASSPTQNDSVTVIHKTAGAASWSHRVTATTGGGINVKCTGEAGKTIRWVTRCTATQLFD